MIRTAIRSILHSARKNISKETSTPASSSRTLCTSRHETIFELPASSFGVRLHLCRLALVLLIKRREVTLAFWSVAVDVERKAIQRTTEGVACRKRNGDNVTTLFLHELNQRLLVLFHDAYAWTNSKDIQM